MPRHRPKPRSPHAPESEVLAGTLQALSIFGPAVDFERQNTGGLVNARGRYVAFGRPGNSDIAGVLRGGRKLAIECKHGGFVPRKARGKERERFELQLKRLKDLNALGGFGLWIRDPSQAVHAVRRALESPAWRVEFDAEEYPVLTDEPECERGRGD